VSRGERDRHTCHAFAHVPHVTDLIRSTVGSYRGPTMGPAPSSGTAMPSAAPAGCDGRSRNTGFGFTNIGITNSSGGFTRLARYLACTSFSGGSVGVTAAGDTTVGDDCWPLFFPRRPDATSHDIRQQFHHATGATNKRASQLRRTSSWTTGRRG
jgi:hypothetical protein